VNVSIIVPAYRADPATLRRCLESVLSQRFDGEFEVILSVSADTPEELPLVDDHPRLTVLTHVPRLNAAAARNRAVLVARGTMLAFTDADAVAEPDWVARLVDASRGRLCVAGAVRNGTPESAAGTVEYLVEFLDLSPRRPPATLWHGATCNLLLPRHLWERHGPFAEDILGGEDTLLTVATRREGVFAFAPRAVVTHLNRTRTLTVLAHQRAIGRYSAQLGRRSPYRLRALVRYTALAPLAVVARVASLYLRLAAWERPLLLRALRLGPLVVLAFLWWGAGLAAEGLRSDLDRVRSLPRPPDRGAAGRRSGRSPAGGRAGPGSSG
jgi:glycosyltransferase involved in cell wall biosynthesis